MGLVKGSGQNIDWRQKPGGSHRGPGAQIKGEYGFQVRTAIP
jgi:hypothetical protein